MRIDIRSLMQLLQVKDVINNEGEVTVHIPHDVSSTQFLRSRFKFYKDMLILRLTDPKLFDSVLTDDRLFQGEVEGLFSDLIKLDIIDKGGNIIITSEQVEIFVEKLDPRFNMRKAEIVAMIKKALEGQKALSKFAVNVKTASFLPAEEDDNNKDLAMLDNKKGGIDLTSNQFLQTQNQGQDIKFHLDPAMLKQLQNAPGFTPVIINIHPMTDLRTFLGLNEASSAKV
jgi:hypothetical protein